MTACLLPSIGDCSWCRGRSLDSLSPKIASACARTRVHINKWQEIKLGMEYSLPGSCCRCRNLLCSSVLTEESAFLSNPSASTSFLPLLPVVPQPLAPIIRTTAATATTDNGSSGHFSCHGFAVLFARLSFQIPSDPLPSHSCLRLSRFAPRRCCYSNSR